MPTQEQRILLNNAGRAEKTLAQAKKQGLGNYESWL